MKTLVCIALALMALGCASGEETYESSAHLCDRCNCTIEFGTLLLNCSAQGMHAVLANWPTSRDGENYTRIAANFDQNAITELAPLPSTSLELLIFFTHNGIASLESGLFTNCVNVTTLDLSYNNIESGELRSDVFRGEYNENAFEPIALRTLILAHNRLHTIGVNVFDHLVDLQWLDLSGNRFRIVDEKTMSGFENLHKLEYLNLARNRLLHLNNTNFAALTRLRTLDLSFNELDFIPEVIKDVGRTLETLRIDYNPIIDITEADLLGMDALVEFSGSGLQDIQSIKANAFGPAKKLKKVDLSNIGPDVILNDHVFGPAVRNLNLSNSDIELLPNELLDWSQLLVLDLRGNQLYCTCDLHNISLRLSPSVKRDLDAPFCFDNKRYRQYELYELDENVCFEADVYLNVSGDNAVATERILRMILLSTSILLIVCVCIACWLGYVRCVKNRRGYPFAASVLYNPIQSSVSI